MQRPVIQHWACCKQLFVTCNAGDALLHQAELCGAMKVLGWDTSKHMCTWRGVGCNRQGNVGVMCAFSPHFPSGVTALLCLLFAC